MVIFLFVCIVESVALSNGRVRCRVPATPRNPARPPQEGFQTAPLPPCDIAFSGYRGCTERILALYLLNSKYARKSMLQVKKYGQKIYPVIRRPRCRSSPPPARRTVETCHPLSPVRRQGAALLRPGARNS